MSGHPHETNPLTKTHIAISQPCKAIRRAACAQNTHHNTKGNCVLFQAAPRQCSTNRDRVACSPRGCITVDHSRLDKCVRYALESVGVCVCACVKAVLEHGVNARTSQVESRRIKHRRRAHAHTHTNTHKDSCLSVVLFLVAKAA